MDATRRKPTLKLNEDANAMVCRAAAAIHALPRADQERYLPEFAKLVYLLGANTRKCARWADIYERLTWLAEGADQANTWARRGKSDD